jgi:NAD(P)-dependent dehydrogenase (short-subunit alcohol dehydrogenase family)
MVAAAGELDGLVVNVGIGAGRGLGQTSTGHWDRVLAVNLRGPFLCVREALPAMRERGSIVSYITGQALTVDGGLSLT